MEGIYLQRLAKDALGLSEALGTEQGLAVALARGEQPGPRGGGGRNVQVGWVSEKVGKTWENMERSIKTSNFPVVLDFARLLAQHLRATTKSNCGIW